MDEQGRQGDVRHRYLVAEGHALLILDDRLTDVDGVVAVDGLED